MWNGWLSIKAPQRKLRCVALPQNTEIDRAIDSSCAYQPLLSVIDRCNVVSVAIECATLDAAAFSADEYSLRRGRHYNFSPHSTACSYAKQTGTTLHAVHSSAAPAVPVDRYTQRYQRGNRCME
jgi:hypothetical protein